MGLQSGSYAEICKKIIYFSVMVECQHDNIHAGNL